MPKPLVHYKELFSCEVGARAFVVPVDHPSSQVSNTQCVLTTPVVAFDALTGEFETQNTRYSPMPVSAYGEGAPN